ncbi:SGNH hydrolase-type esterase superfamily protein [Wolffia australiana]
MTTYQLLLSLYVLLVLFFSSSLPALEERSLAGGVVEADLAPISPYPAAQSPLAPYPAAQSPLAPALFVLGDSTVDCGTNNFLATLARADRLPYGRDFDTHNPTGRFSNGRVIVDYLALRMDLPFVPSFLGQSGRIEDMIHGVNFASAAAGILYTSGDDLVRNSLLFQGQHVSFTLQAQQAVDTFQKLTLSLGQDVTSDLISKSIVYISIGSNDFIHYYLQNQSSVQSLYLPWEFNQVLASFLKLELENLYSAGVRRVIVMGLAPIGCAPHYLWQQRSERVGCVEEVNNIVVGFNMVLKFMVYELNQKLPNANFVFCDAFEGSMEILANRSHYGFTTTTEACCGLGRYGGLIMCLVPEMACRNASSHVWWDEFHPTDAVNAILADNIWSGEHVQMCHPMNLQEIITK